MSTPAPLAIAFFVPGLPSPGGSKTAFRTPGGKIVVTDSAKRNKAWRSVVAGLAMDAHPGPPLDAPLVVSLDFVVLRPRGHFGTGRNAGAVKRSAPAHPTVKPDVLKLARAAEDALTGVLWRDDCLTVALRLTKSYGPAPGVRVRVEVLSVPHPLHLTTTRTPE